MSHPITPFESIHRTNPTGNEFSSGPAGTSPMPRPPKSCSAPPRRRPTVSVPGKNSSPATASTFSIAHKLAAWSELSRTLRPVDLCQRVIAESNFDVCEQDAAAIKGDQEDYHRTDSLSRFASNPTSL